MPNYKVFQDAANQLKSKIYGSDGAGNVLPILTDASGRMSVAGTISATISATNLDIRDLSATQDNIQIYGFDSTNLQPILTDASGVLAIQDNGGTITVDASNLDIRDLSATSDNIQIYGFDGTNLQQIQTDTSGNLIQTRAFTEATETVTTNGTFTGATARDTSRDGNYSFWVQNTGGTNSADVRLEISPDTTSWLADTSTVTVGPNTAAVMVVNKFLKWTRVAYRSTTAGSTTSLSIVFQGQS